MSVRDTPPFRADHVGSLLRPRPLLEAREAAAAGRLGADELAATEDAAIRDVVALQESVGLQSATDGEFRRASWHMDFITQLGGIAGSDEKASVHFENETGDLGFESTVLRVVDKVSLPGTIFGEAFRFLAGLTTTAVPKLTIPSPSMVHYRGLQNAVGGDVYADDDEFFTDLSAAYRDQAQGVYDLGCRYLQLDDTSLAYLNDPRQRAMVAERGGDPDRQHVRYIDQINAAIGDRPEGLHVTTHLCRGNYRSSWAAEGSYDFVAEELFGRLDVDGFFLEFDDARSGGFEPLRFVPPGKQVVLGLVTTKRPQLESRDELKRRVEEASRYVPLDQLCLSPQCGFSSTVEGNALTEAEEIAKLELVVSTAAEIWG